MRSPERYRDPLLEASKRARRRVDTILDFSPAPERPVPARRSEPSVIHRALRALEPTQERRPQRPLFPPRPAARIPARVPGDPGFDGDPGSGPIYLDDPTAYMEWLLANRMATARPQGAEGDVWEGIARFPWWQTKPVQPGYPPEMPGAQRWR